MKIKNLEYFEKLIELKNYSNVAAFFHVGQPTVSMGIKRLEQDVGYDLIVHNSSYNDLVLTPSGEKFHKYSKEIVSQMNDLNNHIKQQRKKTKIDVGMPPMVNHTYFSKLAKVLDKDTLTNINIVEDNSANLIKMLEKRTIDFAIIASTEPIQIDGYHSEILTEDEFRVVVSRDNSLANHQKITFDDVDQAKVIQMSDGYIQSDLFEKIKKDRFSNPDVVYRTSDFNMIKRLVKEDVGISFLLKKSVDESDEIVMIEPESKHIPTVYISLVYPNRNNFTDVENNLLDVVRKSISAS